MENKEDLLAAAKETYQLLISTFQVGTGVHVGTLVSAAARLAGTSLLRTFPFMKNPPAPPGTFMLSNEANQEWPKLMSVMLATLKANGVEIDQQKMIFKIPEKHAPQKDILQMQADLQESYNAIMQRHNLDFRQGANAGAIACAIAIRNSRTFADPQITCGIAALGFIEGCKTAPLPLAPQK